MTDTGSKDPDADTDDGPPRIALGMLRTFTAV